MALLHVWFSTKKRQPVLVDDLRELVLAEFRRLARVAEIALIEAETEYDHVHLLLRLRDAGDLPSVMHLLKGSCSRTVTHQYPELRAEMGKSFWQKSYGARPLPEDQLGTVRWYIRTQGQRPPRHNA
jgi:REP element-mobilizing transposase RayT